MPCMTVLCRRQAKEGHDTGKDSFASRAQSAADKADNAAQQSAADKADNADNKK